MSYYHLLGMTKEPFSTSPDPDFLFLSGGHKTALYRLQIAIELRRGLSVLLGDVGTGKTTLSRKLARLNGDNAKVDFHMIMNPCFRTERQFLMRLAGLLGLQPRTRATAYELMNAIERQLFVRGVEQNRTVILLLDEAQMLPGFVLETLRILLNFETNEYKILQLVLVGQMELLARISRLPNFWDRIAVKQVVAPLDPAEVRAVVHFRLQKAGYGKSTPLFSDEAIRRIAAHTGGYPRKVAMLCHNALEYLVMHDRETVDTEVIESLLRNDVQPWTADSDPADPPPRPWRAGADRPARATTGIGT